MRVMKIGMVWGPNHVVAMLADAGVFLSVVEEMVGE